MANPQFSSLSPLISPAKPPSPQRATLLSPTLPSPTPVLLRWAISRELIGLKVIGPGIDHRGTGAVLYLSATVTDISMPCLNTVSVTGLRKGNVDVSTRAAQKYLHKTAAGSCCLWFLPKWFRPKWFRPKLFRPKWFLARIFPFALK